MKRALILGIVILASACSTKKATGPTPEFVDSKASVPPTKGKWHARTTAASLPPEVVGYAAACDERDGNDQNALQCMHLASFYSAKGDRATAHEVYTDGCNADDVTPETTASLCAMMQQTVPGPPAQPAIQDVE